MSMISLLWYKTSYFFTLMTRLSWSLVNLKAKYVSESDILGPIDYFSDIEILISFERDMFADYSFKNKIKIFLFFMSISPL